MSNTNATNLDTITLRLSPEFGEPCDGPADYILHNWRQVPAAARAIMGACEGRPGSFITPQGLMVVRRV